MRAVTALAKLFGPPALVVAAAAALAGCGGGGTNGAQVASVPDGTSSSASAPAAKDADFMPFVRCLREHGLDVKDPDPDAEDGTIVAMADGSGVPVTDPAYTACQSKWPAIDPGPLWKPADIEKLKRFAVCMRENGSKDYPDPDPETGEQPDDSTYNQKLDPNAPKAWTACDHLYPQSENDGVAG
ncbi:hypothetical protein [Streptomyces sp. NPDC026673]|uniref:hypothetical protein n=1 Tax=Streptomyces sp. NPDC026673 TaxID=3155724 RepID=UPI00340261A8